MNETQKDGYIKELELIIAMSNNAPLIILADIAKDDSNSILHLPQIIDSQIKAIYKHDHLSFVTCVKFYRKASGQGLKDTITYVELLLRIPRNSAGKRVYTSPDN